MKQRTDFLLLKCKVTGPDGLANLARALCAASPIPVTLSRASWQADTQAVFIYCQLIQCTQLDEDTPKELLSLWSQICPDAADPSVSRLERVFDMEGHSSGQSPPFHYVVEMDPEAGWMNEISKWYDTEHMPGLAAVPGCVRASRLLNHDHSPLSLACYDLMSQETLGSPPWLAVRGTAWSDIARPHFTNTHRTMMKVVA